VPVAVQGSSCASKGKVAEILAALSQNVEDAELDFIVMLARVECIVG
jgi:hypothetical protein